VECVIDFFDEPGSVSAVFVNNGRGKSLLLILTCILQKGGMFVDWWPHRSLR